MPMSGEITKNPERVPGSEWGRDGRVVGVDCHVIDWGQNHMPIPHALTLATISTRYRYYSEGVLGIDYISTYCFVLLSR